MVHQCLLTSRFIAPSIPWGVSAPGGKMRKQLLKDHNFPNNSPIFIIESSTLIYLLFKQHCIQYISIWKIVLDFVKGTWHHNFMAGCGSLLWANTCSLWSGIKSWPEAGCLQRLVRRSWQWPTTSLPYVCYRPHDSRSIEPLWYYDSEVEILRLGGAYFSWWIQPPFIHVMVFIWIP